MAYDWKTPTSVSEQKLADWGRRYDEVLQARGLPATVIPVCARWGTDDNGTPVDRRWGLVALQTWLAENASLAIMLALTAERGDDMKRKVARILVQRLAMAAGIIGAIPIPIADGPVLLTLQAFMMRMISDLAADRGKLSPVDIIAELGITSVVGKSLSSWVIRQLLELVPGWGQVVAAGVNGVIAYGLTKVLGEAIVAYYFDDLTVDEIRAMLTSFDWHAWKAEWEALKKRIQGGQ